MTRTTPRAPQPDVTCPETSTPTDIPMLDIRHSNDSAEIRHLIDAGHEAIECSIDGESLVGPLEMDHHGTRSHLEGVAIRAYRDHLGARVDDPRFVVTGDADADATFAIAALAGFLPLPSTLDLTELADLIQRLDVDPLAVDLTTEPWAETVLLFEALTQGPQSHERFVLGSHLWNQLVSRPPRLLLAAARQEEEERRRRAGEAKPIFEKDGVLAIASDVWGFDVWYGRRAESKDPNDPASWSHPLVLAYDREKRSITVGCPNTATANALLGEGGLLNIFPTLQPPGWGGREAIGGSPRGQSLEQDQCIAAARVLALHLRNASG
jgi:hypothetical protein